MKTVKIEVRSAAEAMDDVIRTVASGCPMPYATLTFISQELLLQVLTEKRLQILHQLCGTSPMPVKELASRLDRDVKAVHDDVDALLNAGVVDRKRGGAISLPYDEIIYPAPDSGGRCRSRYSESGASS
ncbi:HVO_A0114 family putative DNA-binding protein [Duganella dendranthematis]|nr:helix-turn-helix domain-containing protein [Duganella dendranthematis]